MRRGLIVALLAGIGSAAAHAQSDLVGEWWTPGFNARVRIDRCGEAVCGRIVWLWDEQPQGIADKQPLIGRTVIDRMQAAAPGRWHGGRLYNPEDGRDYKGTLHLQSPTRLVVDGCVLFICQTQVWRRADPARCPPVAQP
jgi:uncharacterized protein (DUF2147 family)